MKKIIENYFRNWLNKFKKSMQEKPLQKILIIFISPFFIYAFATALLDFGWFTTLGYLIACLHGFSKILDDPYRIIKWGFGYAIFALVTPLIFTSFWPQLHKGTIVSIFTALFIGYVIFMILWNTNKLKNI